MPNVNLTLDKTSVGLGNVDNTSDVNKPVSTAQAAADAAVLSSANTFAQGLVVGLLDDRGNYNASVNLYPSSGGSGAAGAIMRGDLWTVSVGGTMGTQVVTPGDLVRALVDSPAQINANWAVTENNIGYVAENSANKSTSVVSDSGSNVKYPSVKSVFDWVSSLSYLTISAAAATYQLILTEINFGAFISALSSKSTPVDADSITIVDSADAGKAKKASFLNLKATLKTYFDTLYASVSAVTPIALGGTNTTAQVSNGVNYFDGTKITSGSQLKFDGTNLGIGAVPDSLLTVSKQTTITTPPSGTSVHLIGLDANSLRLSLDTHNNAGAGGTAFLGRRSRGTAAAPSAVLSGDTIISLNGVGWGATGFGASSTGLFVIKANQNFTDTAMGTYASIFTTPDGSITAAEAMRINGDKSITVANWKGDPVAVLYGGTGATTTVSARTNLGVLGYALSAKLGTAPNLSPADATTYFWGGNLRNVLNSTGGITKLYIPKSGILQSAFVYFAQTAGSGESSSINIRLNNTTDTLISSSVVNNATSTMVSSTSLGIAVVAGDYVEIKWITPTWATNPTNLNSDVEIYIE